jgi:hypothetical protein
MRRFSQSEFGIFKQFSRQEDRPIFTARPSDFHGMKTIDLGVI